MGQYLSRSICFYKATRAFEYHTVQKRFNPTLQNRACEHEIRQHDMFSIEMHSTIPR